MNDKKPSDFYFTEIEWARTVGYGNVPPERIQPQPKQDDEDKQ